MRVWKWRAFVWGLIYLLVWLSAYTPFLVLTFAFMMIPAVCMYVDLGRRSFLLTVAVSLILLSALGVMAWPLLLVAIFFTVPGAVMGEAYVRKRPARTVVTWGMIALLIQQLIVFVVIYMVNPDMTEHIREFIRDSVDTLPEMLRNELPAEYMNMLIDMMVQMIPFYMMTFAFFYASFSHFLSRRILKFRAKSVAGMPPLSEWMLPRSLVWYYLIILFLDFFVKHDQGSFITTILWNSLPVLMLAFSIQALSFLSFIAKVKGWKRWLPVAGVVMFPFFPQLLSLLGVIDVSFPIRKSLKK